MIKVLLIDDHEMVRIGVSAYLSSLSDIEVAGEAGTGEEGVALALSLRPDIILMDLVMPEVDGIEATKRIIAKWPEAKIIIVTSFIDDEKVYPALEAGATYKGQTVLEPEVTDKLMAKLRKPKTQALHEELTSREREILLLMAKGKSNQEIADELFIAIKTVKTHVSNILSKLQVQDRTQAVIYAFQHHLVEVEE